ncbi:MAG: hypothetical protein KJ060_12345 [Candidatus Hydrogenedentes bacterium]|nr:hypothetical protein [Candidatus Hydrogenedentota bacterium]
MQRRITGNPLDEKVPFLYAAMNKPTQQVIDQVRTVRECAGLWRRDDCTFIRFEGNDVASWLQSQTSNDVLRLSSGDGHANARLDRKGRLQAHFTLHRWEDEYWLLIERQQAPALLEQLDAHLFLEDVRMEDAGDSLVQVAIQGPRTRAFLASLLDTSAGIASDQLPNRMYGCHPLELMGIQVLAFRLSRTGEDGVVLVVQSDDANALTEGLHKRLREFGGCMVGTEAREILRIEAGLPQFGVDMDATNRIPETTLEREAISYEKGCYLGQEVVAKLRAYSSVKQALVGLVLDDGNAPPALDTPLYVNGRQAGIAKSGVFSPTLGAPVCLVYLDRDHRTPGERLGFALQPEGPVRSGRVVVLPFHEPQDPQKRARSLYHRALEVFEQDAEDTDTAAIELLKEAVLVAPEFEDAYEALGVILNRHHRVDEAIHYMKILERLNPDSVMVHTNLSVFYVAKGMIEEAEEEKAKAAVLQMKAARDANQAEQMAAAERERIRQEAAERIRMFGEVLEIDPEDALATFGMGMAFVQLGEYEKALPFLDRATRVQKDYSVAFLNLGKCQEYLDRKAEAIEAYRAGIRAAGRKGDLMPMREMERRLKALGGTESESARADT